MAAREATQKKTVKSGRRKIGYAVKDNRRRNLRRKQGSTRSKIAVELTRSFTQTQTQKQEATQSKTTEAKSIATLRKTDNQKIRHECLTDKIY